METMVLIGAEDVRAGGQAASHAGAEMKQAAATIDYALAHHQRWMEDWLQRFERVVEAIAAPSVEPKP